MTSRDHFSPIGYGTPMTDIVERLRSPKGWFFAKEAAAEIERLRLKVPDRDRLLAEIERLRAALQEIERQGGAEDTLAAIASRALEPKP